MFVRNKHSQNNVVFYRQNHSLGKMSVADFYAFGLKRSCWQCRKWIWIEQSLKQMHREQFITVRCWTGRLAEVGLQKGPSWSHNWLIFSAAAWIMERNAWFIKISSGTKFLRGFGEQAQNSHDMAQKQLNEIQWGYMWSTMLRKIKISNF